MASQADVASLDAEMATWMGIQASGVRYVEWPGFELNEWLGYNKSFFAFLPKSSNPSPTVASTSEGIDAIRQLDVAAGVQAVEPILRTITSLFEDDDCYAFDILAGSVERMNLTLDPERVRENEPMDAAATRWDGQNLADEVDGTIFSTVDEAGMTAWAGIKRRSGPSWDFQVGTREDVRQQGLARLVSSHAIERMQREGKRRSTHTSAIASRSACELPWLHKPASKGDSSAVVHLSATS